MRIISLIPSATEIIYILGLQDHLIARSHDSNYPEEALSKPVVSEPAININTTSSEISRQVAEKLHTGTSVFHIKQEEIEKLRPDLILTQELCKVCAPSFTEVQKAAKLIKGKTNILSLEPESLEDMFENIKTVAKYTGKEKRADEVISSFKSELNEISNKLRGSNTPTVVMIEWMDPIMTAGHWIPEMVGKSGGRCLIAEKKGKSYTIGWKEILDADPDIIIVAPCGFNIKRTKSELNLLTGRKEWRKLKAVQNNHVYLVDGDAYLTRSGPRLVEGTIILAKIIHPDIIGRPTTDEAVNL